MFEVCKVCDKDAAIFNVNVGSEPIKIHIHPPLKLLICREEGIYIAIMITMQQFRTHYAPKK